MIRVAVVGPGRAGRARVRDLESLPGVELAAVVRRTGPPTFEDVLRDSAVDAVAICTPNALHPEQVRQVLEARKHALVEFPLAPVSSEAHALFRLAEDVQRVLHVEHIELLSAGQQHHRDQLRTVGALVAGKVHFRAQLEGWIANGAQAGSTALRAVARLHRLVDLFGPAEVAAATLEESARGYRLEVELRFGNGGAVTLVEERGQGLARGTAWSIDCEHGRLEDPPPPGGAEAGLFERDLACFIERVGTGGASYVSEDRIVHVLEQVERIERALSST